MVVFSPQLPQCPPPVPRPHPSQAHIKPSQPRNGPGHGGLSLLRDFSQPAPQSQGAWCLCVLLSQRGQPAQLCSVCVGAQAGRAAGGGRRNEEEQRVSWFSGWCSTVGSCHPQKPQADLRWVGKVTASELSIRRRLRAYLVLLPRLSSTDPHMHSTETSSMALLTILFLNAPAAGELTTLQGLLPSHPLLQQRLNPGPCTIHAGQALSHGAASQPPITWQLSNRLCFLPLCHRPANLPSTTKTFRAQIGLSGSNRDLSLPATLWAPTEHTNWVCGDPMVRPDRPEDSSGCSRQARAGREQEEGSQQAGMGRGLLAVHSRDLANFEDSLGDWERDHWYTHH